MLFVVWVGAGLLSLVCCVAGYVSFHKYSGGVALFLVGAGAMLVWLAGSLVLVIILVAPTEPAPFLDINQTPAVERR